MPFDYEAAYRQAFRRNASKVADELGEKWLQEKVDSFCDMHGFAQEAVFAEIRRSGVVRALFAKNPNKQNFYETKAAEFIESIPGVDKFKNLPSNALFIVRGGVLTRQQMKALGTVPAAKTIDFFWEYGKKKFYASHKYTKESGGSQENQYKDLRAFIDEANHSVDRGACFLAIADGPFYQGRDTVAKVSKLDRLKQDANNQKGVYACTIDELPRLLEQLA